MEALEELNSFILKILYNILYDYHIELKKI